jgi:mannosyltransferase
VALAIAEHPRAARLRLRAGTGRGAVVALIGLSLASVAPRASPQGTQLWMDEGIAVGIASHPLAQIPGVLRLDGSPPLYRRRN